MEPTAVVSITCPRCGGNVSELGAVSDEQAARCPYCRMELHVPAIGEKVIERWIVREARGRKRTRVAVLVGAPLGALIAVWIASAYSVDDHPRREPPRTTCLDKCPSACATDANRPMCEADCMLRCP